MINKAREFAEDRHIVQFVDYTNTDYIAHLTKVAEWVAFTTEDEEVIAAALLHDTLNNTGLDYSHLVAATSRRVASLVDGVGLIGIADVEPAVNNIWLAEFIDEAPRIMLWGDDKEKAALAPRINIVEQMDNCDPFLLSVAAKIAESWRK